MEISNIHIGNNVKIDPSSSVNNVTINDHVKIAKFCSIYGSQQNVLQIGEGSYIGMFSLLNGFAAKLTIGKFVSIAQNVNIMTDSGPNASEFMQQFYPIVKGAVVIEDHVWIGAGVTIMPNVCVGRCSIIAAHSFVNADVEPYALYAGTPAKLIKKLTDIEEHDRKEI